MLKSRTISARHWNLYIKAGPNHLITKEQLLAVIYYDMRIKKYTCIMWGVGCMQCTKGWMKKSNITRSTTYPDVGETYHFGHVVWVVLHPCHPMQSCLHDDDGAS